MGYSIGEQIKRGNGELFASAASTNLTRVRLEKDGYQSKVVEVGTNQYALEIVSVPPNEALAAGYKREDESTVEASTAAEKSLVDYAGTDASKRSPDERATEQAQTTPLLSAAEKELADTKRRLQIERELAQARLELRALQEQNADEAKNQPAHVRREGDPYAKQVEAALEVGYRLRFPERAGYLRRIVNDDMHGQRVAMLERMGYQIVYDDSIQSEADRHLVQGSQLGGRVERHVGLNAMGQSQRGVLMEIPLGLYNRIQQKKQERVDDLEKSLYRMPNDLKGVAYRPER